MIQRNNTNKSGRRFSRLMSSAALVLATAPMVALAGGGRVLPPEAKPHGYSLADMAKAVARFTTSGNDLAYYPNTPFQVLFTGPANYDFSSGGLLTTGGNTFEVPAGTPFYVPIFNADDSPPILGIFPTHQPEADDYFFDSAQLGGLDFEIIVDGRTTRLGGSFLAGPVETAPLLDGGGTHIITLGVFLSPMSEGSHTVTIQGGFFGELISADLGLAFYAGQFTYQVNVSPNNKK